MEALLIKSNLTKIYKQYHKNCKSKYPIFLKKCRFKYNLNQKGNQNSKTKSGQETNNLTKQSRKLKAQ